MHALVYQMRMRTGQRATSLVMLQHMLAYSAQLLFYSALQGFFLLTAFESLF